MKSIATLCGVIMLAFGLSGCGAAPAAPDVSRLRAPPAWTMAAPCKQQPIPADEANPTVRVVHYKNSRTCHARTRDQVLGLQRYVRTIRRQ